MSAILLQATASSAPSTFTLIGALLAGNLLGGALIWWRRRRRRQESPRDVPPEQGS